MLVSADLFVEYTTVLGSCIAACLFDPDARLGGMNHFLLAEPTAGMPADAVDEHHGIYLMDALVNEMISQGASRQRLRAHLYGGANLHTGMKRIGAINAGFARAFLAREQITLLHEEVGGDKARLIYFRPALGRVRCQTVADCPSEHMFSLPSRHRGAGSAAQIN